MATSTEKATRPWTVTVVIVLAAVAFLEELFVAILGVLDANHLDEAFAWGTTDSLTHGQVVAGNVAGVIIAILGLAATVAYARGSRNGTIALAILTALSVAGAIMIMRTYGDFRPALGPIRLVAGVVVLYLLFQQRDEVPAR